MQNFCWQVYILVFHQAPEHNLVKVWNWRNGPDNTFIIDDTPPL